VLRACFPLVNSLGASKVAELLIFSFDNPAPKAICFDEEIQKKAMILAELCGRSFLLVFTEDFEGDSWMCAAAAALCCSQPERMKGLCFSGAVSRGGRIARAVQLEAKKKLCSKQGLRLITSIESYAELEYWLNSPELPVPLIQCSGEVNRQIQWLAKMEATIREEQPCFSLQALSEFTGLNPQELCLFHPGEFRFVPEEWKAYLSQVTHFDEIEQKAPDYKLVFWYAGMLSALQFGIGARFGFKRPICICHWDSGEQKYLPVIKLYGSTPARTLKNVSIPPDSFQFIKYQAELEQGQDCAAALILYLGSHNPFQDAISHLRNMFGKFGYILVSLQENQGQISLKQNWLRITQEINSLVNHLKMSHRWSRLHIFQSAPTAICMALGIAFGHFIPVSVYHYQYDAEDPKYRMMYDLEKIWSYETSKE